jgi:hypothetical protein
MRKLFLVTAVLTLIIARNYSDLWGLGREFLEYIDTAVKSDLVNDVEQKWDDIYINGENKGYFAKMVGLGINDPKVFIEAAIGSDDNNWIVRTGQKEEQKLLAFIPQPTQTPKATPIPATVSLLATGLIGLAVIRKRWFKKRMSQ